MSLTTSEIAGLIIGILLLTTLFIIGFIPIYRHHTRTPKANPTAKPTSPEPEYALPGPVHEPGTIRRTTGQPQTFYDWVRSSDAEVEGTRHEWLPASENGRVPTASSELGSMYSRPGPSVEARPESGDVVRTSSLRDAVLGVGPIKKGGDMEAAKEVQVEDAKKAREYSGAWP